MRRASSDVVDQFGRVPIEWPAWLERRQRLKVLAFGARTPEHWAWAREVLQ